MFGIPFSPKKESFVQHLLLTICLAFIFSHHGISQNLRTGDLAVLGVATNLFACNGVSGGDEISFVCFKDIQSGTIIDVTDNGWERCYPDRWSDREGVLRFIRTGGTIPAGQIITWQLVNTGGWGTYEFISPDNGWQVENLNVSVALPTPLNMNAGGDQLWFLSGGQWENSLAPSDNQAQYIGGEVLFGLNTKSLWQPECIGPTATQNSALHPEAASCNSVVQTAASDFVKYTGDFSPANQLTWLKRIHDNANWSRFASCMEYQQAPPILPLDFSIDLLPIEAGLIADNSEICKGDSLVLRFELPMTGGPFDVEYEVGEAHFSLQNLESGFSLGIVPDTSIGLKINGLSDFFGCSILDFSTQIHSVEVHWPDTLWTETLSCFARDRFVFEGKNRHGCDSSYTEIFKTADQPLSMLRLDTSDYNGYAVSCFGESDAWISVLPNGGFGQPEVVWSNGILDTLKTDCGAGIFSFKIVDSIGCELAFSVELHSPDSMTFEIEKRHANCSYAADGQIEITKLAGGISPYLAALNSMALSPNMGFENLAEGDYNIRVEDANGCAVDEQIALLSLEKLDSLPVLDTLIGLGASFEWILPFTIDSFHAQNFEENIAFLPPQTLVFSKNGGADFKGILFSENQCPTAYRVRVAIKNEIDLYAPNVFSPTDGLLENTLFFPIFSKKQIPQIDLFQVFDRFGNMVHEERNTINLKGWNGYSKGNPVQTGVYLWLLNAKTAEGTPVLFSGDVLMMR